MTGSASPFARTYFLPTTGEIRTDRLTNTECRFATGMSTTPRGEAEHHPVGFDPLGSDLTVVSASILRLDLIIGLDPVPSTTRCQLGSQSSSRTLRSKKASADTGWHVWERANISWRQKGHAARPHWVSKRSLRSRPDRFLDYLRFEREAQALQLDPPLRFAPLPKQCA